MVEGMKGTTKSVILRYLESKLYLMKKVIAGAAMGFLFLCLILVATIVLNGCYTLDNI